MSESTEYPSIRVLDLALFIKERLSIINETKAEYSSETTLWRTRELEVIQNAFPIIKECLEHVNKVDREVYNE